MKNLTRRISVWLIQILFKVSTLPDHGEYLRWRQWVISWQYFGIHGSILELKLDQKPIENFEMWYWRTTNRVTPEVQVLQTLKEENSILHIVTRMKADWIGHILRPNWLIKHVIEGNTEEKRIRGKRRKQLLCDSEKEKLLESERQSTRSRSVERTRSGKVYEPVAR